MSGKEGAMRAQKLHTMNPRTADAIRRLGFDEIYHKFRQLDEAAALVEEGVLKEEVYNRLVENVEKSLEKQMAKNKKASEYGLFKEMLSSLRPKEEGESATIAGTHGSVTKHEKPIFEHYLWKRATRSGLLGKHWKKRYCMLYSRALVLHRRKGDSKVVSTIILTPEFFVQKVKPPTDEDEEEEGFGLGFEEIEDESINDDSGSVTFNSEKSKDRKHHQQKKDTQQHCFILSDLNMKYQFAALNAADLDYWVHMLSSVIRKIIDEESYFPDAPKLMGVAPRNPTQIQADYEQRKENYQRSQRQKTIAKTKRRSFFKRTGKKGLSEEEWEREEAQWEKDGHEKARDAVTEQMLEAEREHVRHLEEEQRKREEELEKVREFAEEWKRKAQENLAKMEEAESRAEKAEAAEHELMSQLRAQNLEREEAIKAEQEVTKNQLDSIIDKRRGSQHPHAMQQYEQEIKALQAKLAALQSALDVNLDNLDWDGTLEMAERKMKECVPRMMGDDEKDAQDAQADFDQWDKIVRNHADYRKREQEKWEAWEEEEAPKNKQAYKIMTDIVPKEVLTGVSEPWLRSRGMSSALAKRVMQTKILQFLYMPKETIAKLHIADLSSRFIPQGLDIVEVRAIYYVLPEHFELDRDGRKKQWLEAYRQKLFTMTEKEKANTLTRPEERHPAYRGKESPASFAGGASKSPGGKTTAKKKKKTKKPQVAKKVNTKALEGLFAVGGPSGAPGGDDGGKKGLGGLGGGPPPHVLAMLEKSRKMANGGDDDDSTPAPKQPSKASGNPSSSSSSSSKRISIPKIGGSGTSRRASNSQQAKSGGGFLGGLRSLMGGSGDNETKDEGTDIGSLSMPAKPPKSESSEPTGSKYGSKSRKPKSKPTEKQRLLAADVRGMMDEAKAKYSVEPDDFDEKSAPAFDFGVDYSSSRSSRRATLSKQRAGEFSKGVEKGIDELCKFIKEHGKYNPAQGGIASIKFGELFDKYQLSDMLVGLLMRAKKRKRVKYEGDLLFQGIHDEVIITLMHLHE